MLTTARASVTRSVCTFIYKFIIFLEWVSCKVERWCFPRQVVARVARPPRGDPEIPRDKSQRTNPQGQPSGIAIGAVPVALELAVPAGRRQQELVAGQGVGKEKS